MSKALGVLFAGWLVLISQASVAAIDTYEFKDNATRERFQELSAELRCPKCQNQNIADSNSPIAEDLRDELYRMLDSGADNDEIIDFMVMRYGEFVLYRPRVSSQTYLLWYAPAGLLVIGVAVIFALTRRKKSVGKQQEKSGLSPQEQQRLDALLKQDQDKDA
ncbi:cytochrome c-type biogenesis protein [Aliamphritea ceti]|uniref:cytochrome c-type biogenesis protein n=1 Tax=Aliamphritea ceti TaxID=1524258 RepID=UPI0021C32FF8|nr:cytochrome c-type biogenesis protein [Aliamphritea ceti]